MKGYGVLASCSEGLKSTPPIQTVQTVVSVSGRGVWAGDSSCSMALTVKRLGACRRYGQRAVCFWSRPPTRHRSDHSDGSAGSDGIFRAHPPVPATTRRLLH